MAQSPIQKMYSVVQINCRVNKQELGTYLFLIMGIRPLNLVLVVVVAIVAIVAIVVIVPLWIRSLKYSQQIIGVQQIVYGYGFCATVYHRLVHIYYVRAKMETRLQIQILVKKNIFLSPK